MPENRIVSVDDLLVDAVLDGLSRVTATQFFFSFFCGFAGCIHYLCGDRLC